MGDLRSIEPEAAFRRDPLGLGRCVVAAEVGINHNGDMTLARECIDAAAAAGADVVKFQNYLTEDFVSDRQLTLEYISQGVTVSESQYDLFKRCELRSDALRELAAHCARRGVIFQSTPTSEDGVRALVEVGATSLKNGSDYLLHLPLIQAMGRTGLPTVLSTGMATLSEIDEAVRAFRDTGNRRLLLLLCVSCYPTPPDQVNLRRLGTLAAAFGCPVGFSDHTFGNAAAIGAVALGACWIEKHFTLSRDLPGPDHRFSADPAEMRALVDGIRTIERALGDGRMVPAEGEAVGRREYRLSCVAAHALPGGHLLGEADIAFRRPSSGLPPGLVGFLIGRRLARPVESGQVLASEDLA